MEKHYLWRKKFLGLCKFSKAYSNVLHEQI
jgi:hypothetical protein